ncbi:MAG: response regulator [Phycisphaerales bacterium]|nr:MAG: response regulator [Phycisphaerales bacterium]
MGIAGILIIDDDPDSADGIKVILEQRGYSVRVAYDPDEGLARMEEEAPDLLILDVMMGRGAGGFVLARKIRKEPRFDNMPILMLTGMRQKTGFSFPGGDPRHPQFLPVDEFLEKPVDPPDLLGRIRDQLAKKTRD